MNMKSEGASVNDTKIKSFARCAVVKWLQMLSCVYWSWDLLF